MKSLFENTIAILILFSCLSCKKETVLEQNKYQFTELQKVDWFLGRWENNSAEGNLSESWKKLNDSTFSGESYFVIENDTVFAETIQLEERNSQLTLVVSVPNQNKEQPVAFKLTENSGNKLIFENPKHDFPTKIIYNQVGSDSMVAEISGMKEGVLKSELFKMKKVR
ncbi:DUF6265 family protein [Flavobacterium sp. SM2513]|uniref:DUF6265 family protein n=1 Tax=Flavobacterium sp. SM2513 TaxID=3424766 RepID=UPI003D7F2279